MLSGFVADGHQQIGSIVAVDIGTGMQEERLGLVGCLGNDLLAVHVVLDIDDIEYEDADIQWAEYEEVREDETDSPNL